MNFVRILPLLIFAAAQLPNFADVASAQTTSGNSSIDRSQWDKPVPGAAFIGKGAFTWAYENLEVPGEVRKIFVDGPMIRDQTVTFHNDVSLFLPEFVDPLTPAGKNSATQKFADGYTLDEIEKEAKRTNNLTPVVKAAFGAIETITRTERLMSKIWAGGEWVLDSNNKMMYIFTTDEGNVVFIDRNEKNMRFNADGSLRKWFDPVAVVKADEFNQLFGTSRSGGSSGSSGSNSKSDPYTSPRTANGATPDAPLGKMVVQATLSPPSMQIAPIQGVPAPSNTSTPALTQVSNAHGPETFIKPSVEAVDSQSLTVKPGAVSVVTILGSGAAKAGGVILAADYFVGLPEAKDKVGYTASFVGGFVLGYAGLKAAGVIGSATLGYFTSAAVVTALTPWIGVGVAVALTGAGGYHLYHKLMGGKSIFSTDPTSGISKVNYSAVGTIASLQNGCFGKQACAHGIFGTQAELFTRGAELNLLLQANLSAGEAEKIRALVDAYKIDVNNYLLKVQSASQAGKQVPDTSNLVVLRDKAIVRLASVFVVSPNLAQFSTTPPPAIDYSNSSVATPRNLKTSVPATADRFPTASLATSSFSYSESLANGYQPGAVLIPPKYGSPASGVGVGGSGPVNLTNTVAENGSVTDKFIGMNGGSAVVPPGWIKVVRNPDDNWYYIKSLSNPDVAVDMYFNSMIYTYPNGTQVIGPSDRGSSFGPVNTIGKVMDPATGEFRPISSFSIGITFPSVPIEPSTAILPPYNLNDSVLSYDVEPSNPPPNP